VRTEIIWASLGALGLLLPRVAEAQPTTSPDGGATVALTLSSPAFKDKGEIPSPFTCEGKDLSPALAWSEPPQGTKSFALIVDDPDAPDPKAPKTTWVHWVLYNLPADARALPEAVSVKDLPKGSLQGTNDWKRTGWGGPCPPVGRHRYFFKLYALDSVLPDLGSPAKGKLEKAIEGHVLGKAELVGTYEKKNKK
jgi:Raf kinase inhibitor-like YbhB/YbcL family protein